MTTNIRYLEPPGRNIRRDGMARCPWSDQRLACSLLAPRVQKLVWVLRLGTGADAAV